MAHQLLSDEQLDQVRDLRDWQVTEIGAGRNLVEASNLAAWYAAAQPDPEVLASARRDFAELLFTPASLVA